MLKRWLAHPLTHGLDLDDPRTTELRRRIIQEKPFLHHIYETWYAALAASIPAGGGDVLELGSGGGFLEEWIPDLITSDILPIPGVELVLDGQQLPFQEGALRGIVMTNVFHHLSEPRRFLKEAARCVRPGGVMTMVEPWVTPWSRLVYGKLHYEPFDPSAGTWEFPSSGPLSGANGAQAWILFARDRRQFEREFPEWRIASIVPDMPLSYLLSGGVAIRALCPGWAFPLVRGGERLLRPGMNRLAMFAQVTLVRTDHDRVEPAGTLFDRKPPEFSSARDRAGVPDRGQIMGETAELQRADREIAHGRLLASSDPERVWGWGTPAGVRRAERRAALIAAGARLGPGSRALEIGCGTGQFTELFARFGGRIVAVDISPDLLARARARALSPERVVFLEKRFEDCDVGGPFDAVIGSSVLHHLDLDEALSKIYELLKPGGRASFAEPNMLNPQVFAERRLPFLRRWFWYVSLDETAFERRQLRKRLERAGFVEIEIQPFDWLHPATPARLVNLVERGGLRMERMPLLREFAGSLAIHCRRPES